MPTAIQKPKLLDQVRAKIRLKGYARSTEQAYCHWVRHYVLFHDKRHPLQMGAGEIEAFLSYLASERNVSSSTQNQALAALAFLYKEVLERPLERPIDALRAKKYKRIPSVLSTDEIKRLLCALSGMRLLMASLAYGAGLRLSETLALRIQDIDFANHRILVRNGKGRKDRLTLLPTNLVQPLQSHLLKVKALHVDDLGRGYGASVVPQAYARHKPTASKDFTWQFVFPSSAFFHDAKSGVSGRWHVNPSTLQDAIRRAATQAGISKRVTVHTLRHSFATHMLEDGCDIRSIQALLGHAHINTTMIYTHLVDDRQLTMTSPYDRRATHLENGDARDVQGPGKRLDK